MSAVPNDQAVYIAEGAIERAGLDGGLLGWRLGHPHHPDEEGRAESAKASALAQEISGDPTLIVHISNWGDGLASYSPVYHTVTVRPNSTRLSFLHEVAHAIARSGHGEDSHGPAFIRTTADLYREHLSPEAADIFWNLVGDRTGDSPAAMRTEGPETPGDPTKLISKPPDVGRTASEYDTGDGRGHIELDGTFETECDDAHPMKLSQVDREAFAKLSDFDKQRLSRENWPKYVALRDRKKGYLCPGGEMHYYSQWTVQVDGEWTDDVYDTFSQAKAALEAGLGHPVTVQRRRKPPPEPTALSPEDEHFKAVLEDELEGLDRGLASFEERLKGPDAQFVDQDHLDRLKRRREEVLGHLDALGKPEEPIRTEGPGRKWTRFDEPDAIGYESGNARIYDNGPGVGPTKGGGRWALEIDGKWVANIDTLAQAKERANEGYEPPLSADGQKALDIARENLKDRGSVTASLVAAQAGEPFETRKWSSVLVALANKGLLDAHADAFVGKTFYTLPGEGGAWKMRTEGPDVPDLKWKKIEDGGYEDTTGTYRITRHEIDDSWDTGALVKRDVQWTFEAKNAAGEFVPVELHNSLAAAKRDATRSWQRRLGQIRTEGVQETPPRFKRPVRVTFKPGEGPDQDVDQVVLDVGASRGLDLNVWYGMDEQDREWTIRQEDVLRIEEMNYDFDTGELVPREFLMDGPAREHLDLLFLAGEERPWVGRLTLGETDALAAYRNPDGFQAINGTLRNYPEQADIETYSYQRPASADPKGEARKVQRTIAEWAALLDSAIAKSPPTGEDLRMHLYRGIRDAPALFGPDGPQIGQRVPDPAYISTTHYVEQARGFAQGALAWMPGEPPNPVMLEIELPSGVKGAWMPGAFGLDEFGGEYVLPRDSTLEVVGKYQELGLKPGTTLDVVEMRYVDPNELVRTEGPLHPQPNLLNVYHGTGVVFDEFDAEGGYYSSWGKGVYLTTNRGRAAGYALGEAPHIRMARVDNATAIDLLSTDPDYLDSIRANVDAVLTPEERADLRSFEWGVSLANNLPITWDSAVTGMNLTETLTVWFNRQDSEDGKADGNAVLARAGYTGVRFADEFLIFDPADVLAPYGEPRTEGVPPSTIRLYHGTTNLALERSTEDVLRARSMRDLANEVEDDFDLPRDSIWSHDWFMFERDREGGPSVHLAAERRTAESYASRGGEALEGALRTVWRIQKGEDARFPHDGLAEWEQFKQDYFERKGITPVVLALDVPVEQIPVPRDLTVMTPEEWRAILPLPGDYEVPEVDLNWQAARSSRSAARACRTLTPPIGPRSSAARCSSTRGGSPASATRRATTRRSADGSRARRATPFTTASERTRKRASTTTRSTTSCARR